MQLPNANSQLGSAKTAAEPEPEASAAEVDSNQAASDVLAAAAETSMVALHASAGSHFPKLWEVWMR